MSKTSNFSVWFHYQWAMSKNLGQDVCVPFWTLTETLTVNGSSKSFRTPCVVKRLEWEGDLPRSWERNRGAGKKTVRAGEEIVAMGRIEWGWGRDIGDGEGTDEEGRRQLGCGREVGIGKIQWDWEGDSGNGENAVEMGRGQNNWGDRVLIMWYV